MDELQNGREIILQNLSSTLRKIVGKISSIEFDTIEEIRLRRGRAVVLEGALGRLYITKTGEITPNADNSYFATESDIIETLELMSESSVYAFLEEIKKGFITIKGGHRVGICGRAVTQNGSIVNISNINGINVRIAKEITGAADEVMSSIWDNKQLPKNTLIISPPQCGKTTMLRDIARQIGDKCKVGIVDERGELAACHQGKAQYDIGINTDVLDLCPKAVGIDMLIRSMSPEVVVVDEIATLEDMQSVKNASNSGVRIIASAHGSDLADVVKRINLCAEEFDKIIILSRRNGAGTVEQ